MAGDRDAGGRRSLLGYYYQMLATLGITIEPGDAVPNAVENRFNCTISQIVSDPSRVLLPEHDGQDLAISTGAGAVLFQMKHSENPDTVLEPSDFYAVLESFAHTQIQREKAGAPVVHAYFLLTNRQLHPTVAEVVNTVQACVNRLESVGQWQQHIPDNATAYKDLLVITRFRHTEFRGQLDDLVKQWLSKYDRKGVVTSTPDAALVETVLRLLPVLRLVAEASTGRFNQVFEHFAERFGATSYETERAKDRLFGKLMQASIDTQELDRHDLVRSVTEFPDARPLTPAGMGGPCTDEWKRWISDRDLAPGWTVRRYAKDLDNAVADGARIIVLIGQGGCGKTELLRQFTGDKISTLSESETFAGFAMLQACLGMTPAWLEEAVGRWANRGTAPEQRLDDPISRLIIANPNAPILLWVGLDGLDEQAPGPAILGRIVDAVRCRTDPDVRLLITSRGREYRDVHPLLHPGSMLPHDSPAPDTAIIRVDEFSTEDLSEVLLLALGSEALDLVRIEENSSLGVEENQAFPHEVLVSPPTTLNADPIFFQSLRHPRMSGAAIHAEKRWAGTTRQALAGDQEARARIARSFLYQFLSKYRQRRRDRQLPPVREFAECIHEVAVATIGSTTALTEIRWRQLCRKAGIEASKTTMLFNEAASGGLLVIVDDSSPRREWEWKHQFVASYLCAPDFQEICPNE